MIYITGDTHGEFNRFSAKLWKAGKELTDKDYVIILGDFGGVWSNNPDNPSEDYWFNWLNSKPWTTLFVDGNHENFNRLFSYPVTEKFGGKVSQISDTIYWLRRGQLYNIEGKYILTIGGAKSTDKEHRKVDISWWEREELNSDDTKDVLDQIEGLQAVDYILSHTAPVDVCEAILSTLCIGNLSHDVSYTQKLLQHVSENLVFDRWYFGHFHLETDMEISLKQYTCLYKKIVPLGENSTFF
jgi:predicted phosphohydrolase